MWEREALEPLGDLPSPWILSLLSFIALFQSKCTNASVCRCLVNILAAASEASTGVQDSARVYTVGRYELGTDFSL